MANLAPFPRRGLIKSYQAPANRSGGEFGECSSAPRSTPSMSRCPNPRLDTTVLEDYVSQQPTPVYAGPQPFCIYDQEAQDHSEATEFRRHQLEAQSSSRHRLNSAMCGLKVAISRAKEQGSRNQVKDPPTEVLSSQSSPLLSGQRRQLSRLITQRSSNRRLHHPYSGSLQNPPNPLDNINIDHCPYNPDFSASGGIISRTFATPAPISIATFTIVPPPIIDNSLASPPLPEPDYVIVDPSCAQISAGDSHVETASKAPITIPLSQMSNSGAPDLEIKDPRIVSFRRRGTLLTSVTTRKSGFVHADLPIRPSAAINGDVGDFWADDGVQNSSTILVEIGDKKTIEIEDTGNIFDILAADNNWMDTRD